MAVHQLDHMQIICISLQTDNHASTSPLRFYGPDALPDAQPTFKALKAQYRALLLLSNNYNMPKTLDKLGDR